jgi:hypothetical protein
MMNNVVLNINPASDEVRQENSKLGKTLISLPTKGQPANKMVQRGGVLI